MTTKKREVYQFLARTVNAIQNHVSYVMRQVGPQTGTSKVGHGLRGLQPGAEPCNRDPRFFLFFFFFFSIATLNCPFIVLASLKAGFSYDF